LAADAGVGAGADAGGAGGGGDTGTNTLVTDASANEESDSGATDETDTSMDETTDQTGLGDDAVEALGEAASQSELALAALQNAEKTLATAAKEIGGTFAKPIAEVQPADVPLASFQDLFAAYQQQYTSLRQTVMDAHKALKDALTDAEQAGETADGILQDVIAARTDALATAATELDVFTRLIQRVNALLKENPNLTPAELQKKVEEWRIEILQLIEAEKREADGILKDAAEAYLQKKRAQASGKDKRPAPIGKDKSPTADPKGEGKADPKGEGKPAEKGEQAPEPGDGPPPEGGAPDAGADDGAALRLGAALVAAAAPTNRLARRPRQRRTRTR